MGLLDKLKRRSKFHAPGEAGSSAHGGHASRYGGQNDNRQDATGRHELDGQPATANPNAATAKAFQQAGDSNIAAGQYDSAAVCYGEALKLIPTDPTLLLGRAMAYRLSVPPRNDLALADTNTAIQHNPLSWNAWHVKGQLLTALGDFNGAEEALQNAQGFATGLDKITVQNSIGEVRLKRNMQNIPPAELPTPSAGTATAAQPPAQPLAQPSTSPSPQQSVVSAVSPASSATSPSTQHTTQPVPSTPSTNLSERHTSPDNPFQTSFSNLQQSTASATRTGSISNHASTTQPAQRHPSRYSSTRSTPLPTRTASRTTSAPASAQNTTLDSSNQRPRIQRDHTAATVNQTSASSLPFNSADLAALNDDVPSEPPPSYYPTSNASSSTGTRLTDFSTRLIQLEASVASRSRGKLSLRPYTAAQGIDAIQLLYVGLTTQELTTREVPIPSYLHPTHKKMHVDAITYPGSTFADLDCETCSFYDGKLPGTVTVGGYSKEYRLHQLYIAPAINVALEATVGLPKVDLDKIVARIKKIQAAPTHEDNEGINEFLGLSQINLLQFGFSMGGTRQKRIDNICLMMTRAFYDEPTRFSDFSKLRPSTSSLLTATDQETKLRDYLFQIVLGAELLIRMRLQPAGTSYSGIVTDYISAVMVAADLFMQNVVITNPVRPNPPPASTTTPSRPPLKYAFCAVAHQQNAEGLIRFGEALLWPLMDEARQTIETAYYDLVNGKSTMTYDLCDWLFGMVMPGKFFRHCLMSALVDASPSIRDIHGAPFYENAIIVKNKSYWPKRTVLGRVLGGLKDIKSVCGWIGPAPAPVKKGGSAMSGWIRLNAKALDVPTPVTRSTDPLAIFGFTDNSPETTDQMISSITDPSEYILPTPPSRLPNPKKFELKRIILEQVEASNATTLLDSNLPKEEYRAALEFEAEGQITKYTLYSNPIFVCAPPCIGSHVMFRRQAQSLLESAVLVADLKETYLPSNSLLVINAQGPGDEVVARAWCAERGKHAIVRRDIPRQECCFACAVNLALSDSGLNLNVLIWSKRRE